MERQQGLQGDITSFISSDDITGKCRQAFQAFLRPPRSGKTCVLSPARIQRPWQQRTASLSRTLKPPPIFSWLSKLERKTTTPSPSQLVTATALQPHDWPNSSLLPSSAASLSPAPESRRNKSSAGCPAAGWETTEYTSVKVLNIRERGCRCNPEYSVHYPTDT